jgi:hypothetical protein
MALLVALVSGGVFGSALPAIYAQRDTGDRVLTVRGLIVVDEKGVASAR